MTPTRLMYSKSNRAFVFTAEGNPVRLTGKPMLYRRKSEAIRAGLNQGLLVDERTGHVTGITGRGQHTVRDVYGDGRLWQVVSPEGEDLLEQRYTSREAAEEAAENSDAWRGIAKQKFGVEGLAELGKVATLRTRVGTRVRFAPNPASIALYSNPPSVGEEGEVTTVAHIGGRRSFMPGPGGGLLYIKWDRTGHQGVSPRDVEVVGRSRKAERELSNVETHIEGLEGVSKSDKLNSIGDFTTAYIEAALWSTNDESDESGGVPLDENYGFSDLTNDALDKMIKDCRDFQSANAELLSRAGSDAQNGHDFWLTRNGHGAGFWDRGYDDEVGKGLTDAAHAYGNVYLYVSRGKIHHD